MCHVVLFTKLQVRESGSHSEPLRCMTHAIIREKIQEEAVTIRESCQTSSTRCFPQVSSSRAKSGGFESCSLTTHVVFFKLLGEVFVSVLRRFFRRTVGREDCSQSGRVVALCFAWLALSNWVEER